MKKVTQLGITASFNVWVAVFLSLAGIIRFLVIYGSNFRGDGAVIGALVDLLRWLAVLLIGAKIVTEFWNRFLTDITELRPILFRESVAILLVSSLIFNA